MYPKILFLGYSIPTYFLCYSIGLLVSVSLLSKMLFQKLIVRKYIGIFFASLIGLLLGARIFGMISKLLFFHHETGIWNFSESRHSGIVYFGGLFGYLFTLRFLCHIQKKNWHEISDIATIIIPLFHTFGRIGCFFSGCCYGKISCSKIAFLYPAADQTEILERRIPVQLFEATFEFILFLALSFQYYRCSNYKSKRNLKLLNKYLISYAVWRFFIEFYRGDNIRGVFNGVSFSQIICIFIFGFFLIHILCNKLWRFENE